MDTKDILHPDAVLQKGKLFVLEAFASLISQNELNLKPIPKGLIKIEDKWAYKVERTTINSPASVETISFDGKSYFSAADLAIAIEKKVLQTPRGLLLISNKPIVYKGTHDKVLDDCVVTLFDTPDKLVDPDIATEYIPTLKRQGKWTDYV